MPFSQISVLRHFQVKSGGDCEKESTNAIESWHFCIQDVRVPLWLPSMGLNEGAVH